MTFETLCINLLALLNKNEADVYEPNYTGNPAANIKYQ